MDNRIIRQKEKEWRAIKKIIPAIDNFLHIRIVFKDKQYESESPDFYFSNGKMSIGIEVIECHPSVKKGRKDNAPARISYQEKICKQFCHNSFLESITTDSKLNIVVYRGISFNMGRDINLVCDAIESHLRAWHENKTPPQNPIISKIRVIPTIGRNIVQFNNIARRDPVCFASLENAIEIKQRKYEDYVKNQKCNEYWLCIYLPFEENVQSNCIKFENEELYDEFNDYLNTIKYDRICVTSEMPKDIFWIKGNPLYVSSDKY